MTMIDIDRRALYNSLRMNWLLDPDTAVEAWQVEDYRLLSEEAIFDRLHEKGVQLQRGEFLSFSQGFDAPEELADALLERVDGDVAMQDEVYLLLFELWRRFVPEKPCLSVFCDELDCQIHLYDQRQVESAEAIQDVLANLQAILDENTDQGVSPIQVFESVSVGCANDIESFLYDFIAEQIDNDNDSYASELLEGFGPYVKDTKWFDFLRARLIVSSDRSGANELIESVLRKVFKEPNLELSLEILSFMVQGGDKETFTKLLRKTLGLLETEEEFQDLLAICIDYLICWDCDHGAKEVQYLLDERSEKPLDGPIEAEDPHFKQLLKLIKQP